MLGRRFEEAVAYAAIVHGDHVRKGGDGVPYMAHLLGVAALVLEDGGGEDEAIAALLHDAVEDRGGPGAAGGHPPPIRRARGRDRARLERRHP